MPKTTVYEASGIGEDLFPEFSKYTVLELRIVKKNIRSLYAVFNGHLVPIAKKPLITPFTVSLIMSGEDAPIPSPIDDVDNVGDYTLRAVLDGEGVTLKITGKPQVYRRPGESTGEVSRARDLAKLFSVIGTLLNGNLDLYVLKIVFKLLHSGWSDPEKVIQEAQDYVGLGSGSTPSFDDFLIGYITGWGSSLRLNLNLGDTTWLSRLILSEVSKDRDYLIDVATLRECAKGRGDVIQQGLRVASIGGSSGIFMLLGVTSALIQKTNDRRLLLKLQNALGLGEVN